MGESASRCRKVFVGWNVRLRVTVAIPLVIGLGLIAAQAGHAWLNREVAARMQGLEAHMKKNAPTPTLATLVVAASPMRFGTLLTAANLREAPWPAASMPKDGFAHVSDLFKDGKTRVALNAIEPNEPILGSQITGPGQKANLASIISKGMKAITIRVDEVIGVAGFVLPGDRVDVLLTHKLTPRGAASDVIEQNLKVLAIDQTVDDPNAKPAVAHAVTLEVTTPQAQKLILAQSVGNLTLVLRPIGAALARPERPITLSELDSNGGARKGNTVSVSVIRDRQSQTYVVPRTGSDSQ